MSTVLANYLDSLRNLVWYHRTKKGNLTGFIMSELKRETNENWLAKSAVVKKKPRLA
jgi:hypothetical protein